MNQHESIECPHCGGVLLSSKCQSATHEPCWYSCSNCGSDIPLETDSAEPLLEWKNHVRHPWFPLRSDISQGRHDSPIDAGVEGLIGRIVVMFAWAENRLWSVLPEEARGRFPSFRNDVKSLDQLRHTWPGWPVLQSPLTVDYMRECAEREIDAVKTCFEAVVDDRDVFAHGALQVEMEFQYSLTPCGESLLSSYSTTDRPPVMARHREPEHHVELTHAHLEPVLARVEKLFRSVRKVEMLSVLTWGAEADDGDESL